MTIFVGFIITFALPDHPSTAWFLSPREKEIALLRTIENQTGTETKGNGINWLHIKEGEKAIIPEIPPRLRIPNALISTSHAHLAVIQL